MKIISPTKLTSYCLLLLIETIQAVDAKGRVAVVIEMQVELEPLILNP